MGDPYRKLLARPTGPLVSGTLHRCLELGEAPMRGDNAAGARRRDSDRAPATSRKPPTTSRKPAKGSSKKRKPARKAKEGRPEVSLRELVDAGVLVPGSRNLSIALNGSSFNASLLENGAISYGGKSFSTLTAFTSHVSKRRPPGWTGEEEDEGELDGWELVRYQNARTLREVQEEYLAGMVEASPSREEGVGEEEAQLWIFCDGCETWRVVPDEEWDALQAADQEQWYCQEATWDVTSTVPFTRACNRRKPRR
eukprot:jgi/Tetstr1/447745/TSEL_035078.t1